MALRRRASPGNVGRITAPARLQPRLFAWVVALGGTSLLFLISHFTVGACALCRLQQFLMVALVIVLSVNIADKRPLRLLRQAIWLAAAGLLVALAHFVLSVGSVSDLCAGIAVCGHQDTHGTNRALPAIAALISFAAVLVLVRHASHAKRRPHGSIPV